MPIFMIERWGCPVVVWNLGVIFAQSIQRAYTHMNHIEVQSVLTLLVRFALYEFVFVLRFWNRDSVVEDMGWFILMLCLFSTKNLGGQLSYEKIHILKQRDFPKIFQRFFSHQPRNSFLRRWRFKHCRLAAWHWSSYLRIRWLNAWGPDNNGAINREHDHFCGFPGTLSFESQVTA